MEIQPKSDINVLIAEAQFRLNLNLPEDIQHYIFCVFWQFLKEKWSKEPIALRMLKLAERQKQEKTIDPFDLRNIGDTALMISAFEMPAMEKRGLRNEYFLTCGASAYEQAGGYEFGALSLLYFSLSDAFPEMVRVIEDVFGYKYKENVSGAVARLEAIVAQNTPPLTIIK